MFFNFFFYLDIDEIQALLLIYREEISPPLLFFSLIKKWEENTKANLSVAKFVFYCFFFVLVCVLMFVFRIIFVLEQWIEHYFMSDFAPNRLLSQQLWHFIGQFFKNTDGIRMLTQSWFNQHYIRVQELKANPIVPSISPICKIDILTDSCNEIAQQLTMIEFQLWERIHISEYLLDDL